MRQRVLSFLLAVIMTLALAVPAFAAGSFTDVPASHWAYSDIMTCADMGAVSGVGSGKFDPDGTVTSAQFVAMVTRTFYSGDVAAAQGAPGAWYAPNVQAANAHGLLTFWSTYAVEVNDQPINRSLMAVVLSNIMDDFGKSASDGEKAGVGNQITDWNNVPASYRREVANCYAKGILTGMSDGRFAGFTNMTRAQACAVVVRMMNLIDGAAPVAPVKPTQPTTPVQPQQPAQPSTTGIKSAAECIPTSSKEGPPFVLPVEDAGGKLSNGKEATPENVMEFLEAFKKKYPQGTSWAEPEKPDTYFYRFWYFSKDVEAAVNMACKNYPVSLQYACGGWAAMVSDTIFGQTGAPPREVTDFTKIRPGDLIIYLNDNGKIRHLAIVYANGGPLTYSSYVTSAWQIQTCDGNFNDMVHWPQEDVWSYWDEIGPGTKTRVFTRYPD